MKWRRENLHYAQQDKFEIEMKRERLKLQQQSFQQQNQDVITSTPISLIQFGPGADDNFPLDSQHVLPPPPLSPHLLLQGFSELEQAKDDAFIIISSLPTSS